MSYYEMLKSGFTQEPIIVEDSSKAFVIIGSYDHGVQLPQESVPKLIGSMNDVVALKMEGTSEGTDEFLKQYHPMSVEMLAKACIDPLRFSWIPEKDDEDIGKKLLNYGVPEGIMEAYVPCLNIRLNGGISYDLLRTLPGMFERYKSRFGFINRNHGVESFFRIVAHWNEYGLDLGDLEDFSYDFEMFMGSVREYEYWRPDLRRFRVDHPGKIAVCCGEYHVPFVQAILEGSEVKKPDWKNHIDKNNYPFVAERRELLKGVYRNLEAALS